VTKIGENNQDGRWKRIEWLSLGDHQMIERDGRIWRIGMEGEGKNE